MLKSRQDEAGGQFRDWCHGGETEHPEPGFHSGPAGRDDAAGERGEISKHSSDNVLVNAVLLKGTIVDGDAYEVRKHIAKLPKKTGTIVYLDSPGGNLREGLKLGAYFYDLKIETVVEAKALCTQCVRAGVPWWPRRERQRLAHQVYRRPARLSRVQPRFQ